jgi:menaquinone-dependent protoporphyrinogen oxidase
LKQVAQELYFISVFLYMRKKIRSAKSHKVFLMTIKRQVNASFRMRDRRRKNPGNCKQHIKRRCRMAKKVLVLYATRAGSTREIAESICKTFIACGMEAEPLPVKNARSPEGYDAVILGTAVRMGMLMPEMVRFVRKKKTLLSRHVVAAFAVCLSIKKETPEHHPAAGDYLDPLRRELPLVSEVLFAGTMEYSKLGFIARFIVERMVKTPEGDFRDWEEIERWTSTLIDQLNEEHLRETVVENVALIGA